jgi:hypothetical protein
MLRIWVDLTKLSAFGNDRIAGRPGQEKESELFKLFNFGLVLGALIAGALLYFRPVVDLARESSIGSARPNGGVIEKFYVDLSTDRVLAGISAGGASVPEGLDWPDYDFLAGTQTEVFKLRNEADKVVGIASRMVGGGEDAFVEWVVHMPARGSLYALLPHNASGPGLREGTLRAGTREFSALSGSVTERFVAQGEAGQSGTVGQLELVTSLVRPYVAEDLTTGAPE